MMIRNCFNYVGSKDRILPLILKNLDTSKANFMDAFCGSGVVGINVLDLYKKVTLNDACWQMIKVLEYFRDTNYEDLVASIDEVINEYSLSKENKEGYDKLREDYNKYFKTEETFSPVMFYSLLTHSFNYNIHINGSGGFSVPFGKNRSYFSQVLRDKLQMFQGALRLNKGKVILESKDFQKVFNSSKNIISNTTYYCDPPYLSSDSSYGRIRYLGKWDGKKEKQLYACLDKVHEKGGSFLLSNVMKNNGQENKILKEWSSKYNVIPIGTDYSNCNYQRKNLGKTNEVLIRNY